MDKISFMKNPERINFKGNEKPSQDEINELINKLTLRAEREMPDKGYFRPIEEKCPVATKDLDKLKLKITPAAKNSETERALEAFIKHKTKNSEASRCLAIGTSEQILSALKDEKLREKLDKFIELASEKFEN